jgi:hypothetical protein
VLRRVGEIPTPWPCFVVAVRNEVIESSGGKLKEMMDVLGGVCREFKADASSSAYIAKEYGLKVSIRRPYCVSNRSAHIAHHLSGIIASCIIHLPEDPESINNLSPDVSPPPTPRCLPFILRHWPPMSHTAARRLCRVVLYRGMVV